MRYEVQRLRHAAHFDSGYLARRTFDALVIDTLATRPAERDVCVAPYVVATNLALVLNAQHEEARRASRR